jgi:hypothetical protein
MTARRSGQDRNATQGALIAASFEGASLPPVLVPSLSLRAGADGRTRTQTSSLAQGVAACAPAYPQKSGGVL